MLASIFIIIIIIIIIIILFITFMLGIYNYIPKTNHIPRVLNEAFILCTMCTACHSIYNVQWFVLLNGYLYYPGSKLLTDKDTTGRCSFTLALSALRVCMYAVPNSVVPWLHSFPVFYSGFVWNVLRSFQLPLLLLVITFVFTIHMPSISIVRSSYFRIFSASFLITFLYPKLQHILTCMFLFLPQNFGLLLGIALSICTCPFLNLITLPSWLVSTDFSASSY